MKIWRGHTNLSVKALNWKLHFGSNYFLFGSVAFLFWILRRFSGILASFLIFITAWCTSFHRDLHFLLHKGSSLTSENSSNLAWTSFVCKIVSSKSPLLTPKTKHKVTTNSVVCRMLMTFIVVIIVVRQMPYYVLYYIELVFVMTNDWTFRTSLSHAHQISSHIQLNVHVYKKASPYFRMNFVADWEITTVNKCNYKWMFNVHITQLPVSCWKMHLKLVMLSHVEVVLRSE